MYSILERSGHFPAQRANGSGKIGKKMKEKASYQTWKVIWPPGQLQPASSSQKVWY